MPSTLATILHRSLDFAGLFPPASLPVPEALRLFRHEQNANTAGMLSRFVCPVPRIEELAVAAAGAAAHLTISALPRGGKGAGEFLANLETDLAAIHRLVQIHDGAIAIDTIEFRPPADALQPAPLRKLLAATRVLLARHPGVVRNLFIELPPSAALASQLEILAEPATCTSGSECPVVGYKLRTGGSDAASGQSSGQIAGALAATATLGVPMKCTGGLHRPIRTTGSDTGAVPLHGFINLLVAAALASSGPTEPGLIEAVLDESDPGAFVFENRTVKWRDYSFGAATITESRRRLLLSFGSCYAEQPRLELQKLGWWPKPAKAKTAELAG